MSTNSIDRDVAKEARLLRASWNGHEIDDYKIVSFSAEDYRPKPFVKKTGSKELYDELEYLLHELWKLNQEHVGESRDEVNVYFELTGVHDSLTHALKEWCHRYLKLRLKKRDPKDHDNPYAKFKRLYLELDSVIGCRKGSVDYLCFDMSLRYTAWLLYEHTWGKLVKTTTTEYERNVEGERMAIEIEDYFVSKFGLGGNDLECFMSRVADSDFGATDLVLETKDDDWLLNHIAGMANDIKLMRPFLIRNFRPEKTIENLHENLAMAFAWTANQGAVQLIVGPDERALLENIPNLRSMMNVKMRRDGVLIDGNRPWLSAKAIDGIGFSSLAVNAIVLELIHKTLFQFFDQIDLEAIRNKSTESDDGFAASCIEEFDGPPKQDCESGIVSRKQTLNIRPLRFNTFLRILNSLGCEICSGKGSEKTVFRPGGKKYRLGVHKEAFPDLIKNVLQRVGISRTEWLEARKRK